MGILTNFECPECHGSDIEVVMYQENVVHCRRCHKDYSVSPKTGEVI